MGIIKKILDGFKPHFVYRVHWTKHGNRTKHFHSDFLARDARHARNMFLDCTPRADRIIGVVCQDLDRRAKRHPKRYAHRRFAA